MKPNPLPLENCTPEESIQYLKTHIENLDEKIEQLEEALVKNENDRQLRAWAVDISSRAFEKSINPDPGAVIEYAKKIGSYADNGDAQ